MGDLDRILASMVPHPQGSKDWLQVRSNMLTASDVGAALHMSVYCSRSELVRYKAGLVPRIVDSFFTGHGNRHEDTAAAVYASTTGRVCYNVGLVVHPRYAWLGASPDRVTACGRAVEIKVPVTRRFEEGQPIAPHYWAQMQLQLEVMDLQVCDFVQYRVATGAIRIDEVSRDSIWWQRKIPSLSSFFCKVLDVRADHELQSWEWDDEYDEGEKTCKIP